MCCVAAAVTARAQDESIAGGKRVDDSASVKKKADAWFLHGRVMRSKSAAELRRRAYQRKMQSRVQRAGLAHASTQRTLTQQTFTQQSLPSGLWVPLGPAPLASDSSGSGLQDYYQVTGRATAVAFDPADSTGNTVYIGGAQGGVWKSTNAANSTAANATWTPLTDEQPTLSIGAIAIQPGNGNPTKSVILAATGEGNSSTDSYFGLGILRSADGGNTWSLIESANGNALSFNGLGGTRMAFNTTNTVVAAMAATSAGVVEGASASDTMPGLYTSLDAGQTWSYNALTDSGSQATDANSATSVAYNASAGIFLAAVRYHGFYSSPDGSHWTRLTNQPGGSALSATTCPPQSISNSQACPIFRGEITVVPGRNEMYAWYVSLDSNGNAVDGGIWQSLNGGTSWTAIDDSGVADCGDSYGCGVQDGSYNLELLAMADGSATDLYAGAINLYKCSINSANPSCNNIGFINLTHAYGCDPIAAPAHVHPSQHALAAMIPASGTETGNALMYFANDGGIYRALNAYSGLTSGSCPGTNQFDDLNQNLGSLAQFVTFSQHPTDLNTLLGGTQGNGSTATSTATTSTSWTSVFGGDGAFNAIDSGATLDWYVSNPDLPPGGLAIQECASGVNCHEQDFGVVIGSGDLDGDDGALNFPYLLDPQSTTALLVGTCRVWRGPRSGGTFTALSVNFETFGTGGCSGGEVNLTRALAAGGPTDANGSEVIYATTDGLGPINGPQEATAGGNVWVTTNATAGTPAFAQVTQNINPDQYPVSSVAIDASDPTGKTAYVTIMGFTGSAGHVWQTANAGASWSDFSGTGAGALPDAPVNAVVVDGTAHIVYVGTDVGVFGSSTSSASWSELGPISSGEQAGFLPNAAVTALAIFNAGGRKLLRASTYGRGLWQFDLAAVPDFQLTVSNPTQTIFSGHTATFNGSVAATGGYNSLLTLSCVAGATTPPGSCTVSPSTLTPGVSTPFTVSTAGVAGDYSFNLQAAGSDASQITHQVGLTLHSVSFGLTTPSPTTVSAARGTSSPPVSFQVDAAGSFSQSVSVSCTVGITGAICNLTPGASVNPTANSPVSMTATVSVPAGTAAGNYTVTIEATTAGAPSPVNTSFTVQVSLNPDFILSANSFAAINAGSSNGGGTINIVSQDGFAGTVSLLCSLTPGNGSCNVSPAAVNSFPATTNVMVNATNLSAGNYQLSIQGVSGATTHTLAIPINVGDYQLSGPSSLTLTPGAQGTPRFTIAASTSYSGQIMATCDAGAISAATCTIAPANPITVSKGADVPFTVTLNIPNDAGLNNYTIHVNTQDASGKPSHSASVSVNVIQDYTIGTISPSSQTISSGQSASYNLSILPVGASYNGSVMLQCAFTPAFAGSCTFSPNPVSTSSGNVVMTVTSQALSGQRRPRLGFWLYATGLGLLPGFAFARSKNLRRRWWLRGLFPLLLLLPSCAGGTGNSSGGGGGGGGTNPGSYSIQVSGSPGSVSQATPPTTILIVQ